MHSETYCDINIAVVFDVGPQPVDGDDDTVARSGFAKDEGHRKFDAINGISFR